MMIVARRLQLIGLLAVAVLSTSASTSARGELVCTDVRSNTTWTADQSPWEIGEGCTVRVINSRLTIDAGVLVVMGANSSIVVERGGILNVGRPDAASQVTFRGSTTAPAHWGQIRFEPTAAADESFILGTVVIANGGRGGVPMVDIRDVNVRFAPIGGSLGADVTFRDAGGPPLAIRANHVGPSIGTGGSATVVPQLHFPTGLGVAGIKVYADKALDITDSATWFNHGIPYLVDEDLTIAGPDFPQLNIISQPIEPISTIAFGLGGSVTVGRDSDNPGSLNLNGGSSERLARLSAQNGQPGGWKGVHYTRHSEGFLQNAVFEHGGAGGQPMVVVDSKDVQGLDVKFRAAASYPLAGPAEIVGSVLAETDEPAYFEANGVERILAYADEDIDIDDFAAWHHVGEAYEVSDTLTIAGRGRAELIISKDLTVYFPEDAQLVVGQPDQPGSLKINGERSRPTVLTGRQGGQGSWGGVHITEDAERSRIQHALIELGGGTDTAMVRLEGETDVNGTTFRGAPGYPIQVNTSAATRLLMPGRSLVDRNSFQSNGRDAILLSPDRALSQLDSTWEHPGVPVVVDGQLVVSRVPAAKLELREGFQLLFAPGSSMVVGRDQSSTGSLVTQRDPGESVVVGALDPESPWSGMQVGPRSIVQLDRFVAENGGSPDGALILASGSDVRLTSGVLRGSPGAALLVDGGSARLQDVSLRSNRIGLQVRNGATVSMRCGMVDANGEWGVLNEDPQICVDAQYVYWGHARGPHDPSAARDACDAIQKRNDNPAGQRVSDGVNYAPWATTEQCRVEVRIYLPHARRQP